MGDGEEVGDVHHVGGEWGTELCELTPRVPSWNSGVRMRWPSEFLSPSLSVSTSPDVAQGQLSFLINFY